MASSSKKKSSSKIKDSKLSSKSKKIKKSHRNASKKIGRRHDSSSEEDSISVRAVTAQSSDSSSENESASLVSLSSSEGTHRSRRKGSRLKKRDKSKVSRRSSSKEELSRGKKRKRSKKKKKGHHESRKKSHKKKHRTRRHVSVSSDDDGSSSSASEENGIQGKRTKVKDKKRRRVESETETMLDKERADKSPQSSSNSRSSDPSYRDGQDGESLVGENNSRRLKSVIVVVKPDEEEENMLEKDSVNGKAVNDDLDGIHPSHSLDTSNMRSKRDPPPHSPLASDRKRTKDFSGGNSSLIIPRVSEPLEHVEADLAPSNLQYLLQEEHRNDTEKNYSGAILPDGSPGENDLETVLRRKALENLKKFRRKVETDVETTGNESINDDDNVDQLSTRKDVVVRRQSPESGGTNIKKNMHEVKKDGVNTNKPSTAFKKDKFSWRRVPEQLSSIVTNNAMLNESIKPPSKRDDPRSSMSVQQIPDKRNEAVKVNAVDPLDTSVLSSNPIKEHGSSQAVDAKSKSSDNLLHKSKHSGMQKTTIKVNAVDPLDTSVLSRNPIKDHGSPQAFNAESESSDNLLHKSKHSGMQKTTNMSSDKETVANTVNEAHIADETNHDTSPISTDDHQRKIEDVSVPSSATRHLSNDDQKNEDKEGSDFKEKKMTVMRGGEMVEVNYKVYIPQRAAALARRKLKR